MKISAPWHNKEDDEAAVFDDHSLGQDEDQPATAQCLRWACNGAKKKISMQWPKDE
jgi:hypothetical protein